MYRKKTGRYGTEGTTGRVEALKASKLCPHKAMPSAYGFPADFPGMMLKNLPFKDTNPKTFNLHRDYVERVDFNLVDGDGLLIYSNHCRDKLRDTGTEKTTTVRL